VAEAITRFETELEEKLLNEAPAAPAGLKNKIWQQLEPEVALAPVVPMRSSALIRPVWKWVAVAAIIIMVGSLGYIYILADKNKKMQEEYASMLAETDDLRLQNQLVAAQLKEMQKGMSMLSDPTIAKVTMPGMGTHTENKAMVLWDTKTKDVYLMPTDLPPAPQGMQYQLWALVDGKPVDAGMMEDCSVVCTMKNIPKADAFAITLQKQGGSPEPDMNSLYVMGKIVP
jgi:anti-sigma-K factor RskA